MAETLYVATMWFSRGCREVSSKFTIDAEFVKKALDLRAANDRDAIEDWLYDLDEYDALDFSKTALLRELVAGFFMPTATYSYDEVDSPEGLAVETEEQLFGVGSTKEAASAALLRLLDASNCNDDW